MQRSNAEILNHFYCLLLEMNFYRPEEDPEFIQESLDDPFVRKHLQKIRLLSARARALRNKNMFGAILAEVERLKAIGMDQIRKLIAPEQAVVIQQLFSRYEELTEEDQKSIAEDQELLQLMKVLKEKLSKPKHE
jgi:hypothetical protein